MQVDRDETGEPVLRNRWESGEIRLEKVYYIETHSWMLRGIDPDCVHIACTICLYPVQLHKIQWK